MQWRDNIVMVQLALVIVIAFLELVLKVFARCVIPQQLECTVMEILAL
jgi:hypothetical protein